MNQNNYILKHLTPDNFSDIKEMYIDAFNETPDLEELRKKYLTGWACKDYMGVIAYHKETGEAASFMGMFPTKIKISDNEFIAAQIGDLMTHSKHRRQGLFKLVSNEAYSLARENNISCLYALGPNELSYPAFVKHLGWKHSSDFQGLLIPTRSKIARKLFPIKSNMNKRAKLISEFVIEPRPYVSLVDPKSDCSTPRSIDFINYKNYNSKYFIQIKNKVIYLRLTDRYFYIGDIENCNKEEFLHLICKLKTVAKKCGYEYIRFMLSKDSSLFKRLLPLGYPMQHIHPITHVNLTQNDYFDQFKMTMIDHDNF